MKPPRPLRLSTRLALTHGVLVGVLVISLLLTLQGLLRMLGLITEIRDTRLSTLDADEDMHRTAWSVEVALRHAAQACENGAHDAAVRATIVDARGALSELLETRVLEPDSRLRRASHRYIALADGAAADGACAYLLAPHTDSVRAQLDEEMTNAWIERMHELHADLRTREDAARRIGVGTAVAGVVFAALAATAAAVVARSMARSISQPIAELARAATRVGEGDFAPIPQARGPAEVQELWRDLERMREHLMELERLKRSFVANVSHELRTPLARLREALGLLSDGTCGPTTPQQERVLALARRACEREVRIVEALLDLSRMSSGLPIKCEAGCDVDRVIEAAVADERAEAEERRVTIAFEREGRAPTLEIDTALVERAVANLVRNAVSVSTAGKVVRVTRRIARAPVRGERVVRIDVTDDGPGVTEAMKATMFQPFSSASVPGVDRPQGIGLGLSFARDVALAHGGELTMTSEQGQGSTFTLVLPADGEITA